MWQEFLLCHQACLSAAHQHRMELAYHKAVAALQAYLKVP